MTQPTPISKYVAASTIAFQSESTIHGVLKLRPVSKDRGCRFQQIGIFLPAVLLATSILIYQTCLTVSSYQTYDTIADISFPVATEIAFPAITICSNNQFFRDAFGQYMSLYLPVFYVIYAGALPYSNSIQMCSSTTPAPAEIVASGGNITWLYNTLLSSGVNKLFNHNSINSLLSCRWQRQSIDCADVFYNHDTDVGFCFTFNPSTSFVEGYAVIPGLGFGTSPSTLEKYNFTVRRPGKRSGIELMLFVNATEYCTSGLQFTYGFSALVHDPNMVLPLSALPAIELLPGFSIEVAIVMRQTSRYTASLPAWTVGYCVNSLPLTMFAPNTPYSYYGCLTECVVNATIKACGCYPVYTPPLGMFKATNGTITGYSVWECETANQMVCQTTVQQLMYSPLGIIGAAALYNQTCICRHACEETDYFTQVSASLYPVPMALPSILQRFDLNASMTLAEFRKNYLLVNFFIADMKYTWVQENQAMTIGDLVNNIGGALGLCLGGSIISILELLMWFCHLLAVVARKTKGTLFRAPK